MDHAEIVGALTDFFEEEDLLEEPDVLLNGTDLIDSGIVGSRAISPGRWTWGPWR